MLGQVPSLASIYDQASIRHTWTMSMKQPLMGPEGYVFGLRWKVRASFSSRKS